MIFGGGGWYATCCLYADFALRPRRKSRQAVPTRELAALDQNASRPLGKGTISQGTTCGNRASVMRTNGESSSLEPTHRVRNVCNWALPCCRRQNESIPPCSPLTRPTAPSSTTASRPPHW